MSIRAALTAFAWLALYVGAILGMILVFLSGDVPPSRSFAVEFGVMLGFALLISLALQFLLTARFHGVGRPFGTDTLLQLHRHAGMLLLLLLLGHPLVLLISEPEYFVFLDPRENALRTIFLILASIAMTLLVVLSIWRKSFGMSYEWWRLTHGAMASGVVLVGLAHSWQVGHYVQGVGKRSLLVAIAGMAVGSFFYVRLWRPWRASRKPYRVTAVRDERGEVSTIVLEPVNHFGMKFRSGQYAWLSIGNSPFTLQQNPYSFSGSDQAAPNRIEFTVKALGDFSERLVETEVGTLAHLEGPFGSFCLEDQAAGAIFIMGGIGVTPAMSILRSLQDQGDPRPMVLFYANSTWAEVAFRHELDELARQLSLRVIHIINEPDEEWTGETGYLSQEILERHLSEQERTFPVFVCGPIPMMDSVEKALLAMGIPLSQMRAERFDMV
jgi:predicted ferric reductase